MADYPLIPGTLASNCWPADPQTLYNEMFAKGVAQVTGGAIVGVIASQTTPSASNRDKLWLKLDGSDRPTRLYYYASGAWLSPHPVPYSGNERRLYVGSAASLITYDEGTNTAVSATSGPFWEIDTDFEARSPIGVGTLPGTSTSLAVGDNFGEEQHTQTAAEVGIHTHDVTITGKSLGGSTTIPARVIVDDDYLIDVDDADGGLATANAGGDPFNVVHPVRAVYFIKRTARQFYVG